MVALRIYMGQGRQSLGSIIEPSIRGARSHVLRAMRATAQQAAEEIESRGTQDVAEANLPVGAQDQAVKVAVSEGGGNIRLAVTSDLPYFNIYQKGGVIKGKPMLWIPLSSATDAKHIYARDYPGRLVLVNRKSGGVPLLLSTVDRKPKYFGISQVTMPKRLHILEIIQDVVQKLAKTYRDRFRSAG